MYWTTETTYVDVETGEQLTKKQVEKKYTKLKCRTKYEKYSETWGRRQLLWSCEPNRQQKLEL